MNHLPSQSFLSEKSGKDPPSFHSPKNISLFRHELDLTLFHNLKSLIMKLIFFSLPTHVVCRWIMGAAIACCLMMTNQLQAQQAPLTELTKNEYTEQIKVLPNALAELPAVSFDQLDAKQRASLVALARDYKKASAHLLGVSQMQPKLDEWVKKHLTPEAQEAYARAKKRQ